MRARAHAYLFELIILVWPTKTNTYPTHARAHTPAYPARLHAHTRVSALIHTPPRPRLLNNNPTNSTCIPTFSYSIQMIIIIIEFLGY